MKRLVMIGGTMGIGKTTVSQKLKYKLKNSVCLDGDWCWDMHPFVINDETKTMVINNIVYQLNQFLLCSSIENIIFCWVMHEQSIIDDILSRLNLEDCQVYNISLVCQKKVLIEHIQKDINLGLRKRDVLQRSLERLNNYDQLKTMKIDITYKSVEDVVKVILALIEQD